MGAFRRPLARRNRNREALARALHWPATLGDMVNPVCSLCHRFLMARARSLKHSQPIQPTTAQTTTSASTALAAPPITSPIDVNAFFHQSYIGQLQPEIEGNVRAMIQSRPPAERDDFVIKFIATGLINVIYDQIWRTIFRSQVLALSELNKKVLRREELKPYYDEAVQKSPKLYATYSFDQWLNYLNTQVLMLEHPGKVFEITVRGKDFLKYLVHWGYTAEDRLH